MDKIYFKTVKEIASWLREHIDGAVLSFTDDTPEGLEINGESTGWYGIKTTTDFDELNIIIGTYGGGILSCARLGYENTSFEEALIDFFESEFGGEYNEDSLICVDADEWDGISYTKD